MNGSQMRETQQLFFATFPLLRRKTVPTLFDSGAARRALTQGILRKLEISRWIIEGISAGELS